MPLTIISYFSQVLSSWQTFTLKPIFSLQLGSASCYFSKLNYACHMADAAGNDLAKSVECVQTFLV
jgi:hypothetical protein